MKTGRNDPCPCGSGKKYKHCCYEKDQAAASAAAAAAREELAQRPSEEPTDEDEQDSGAHRGHPAGERQRFHGRQGGPGGFKPPRSPRGSQRGN